MSIGALTFLDEEVHLVRILGEDLASAASKDVHLQFNHVATAEELLHEIRIGLEQKISKLQVANFSTPHLLAASKKTLLQE